MKRKDVQALHSKTTKELETMRGEVQAQLDTARMEKHAGKLANTSSVKTLSDQLARIKTILRMQALAPAVEEKEVKKTTKKVKTAKKASK